MARYGLVRCGLVECGKARQGQKRASLIIGLLFFRDLTLYKYMLKYKCFWPGGARWGSVGFGEVRSGKVRIKRGGKGLHNFPPLFLWV